MIAPVGSLIRTAWGIALVLLEFDEGYNYVVYIPGRGPIAWWPGLDGVKLEILS